MDLGVGASRAELGHPHILAGARVRLGDVILKVLDLCRGLVPVDGDKVDVAAPAGILEIDEPVNTHAVSAVSDAGGAETD